MCHSALAGTGSAGSLFALHGSHGWNRRGVATGDLLGIQVECLTQTDARISELFGQGFREARALSRSVGEI